MRRAHRSWSGNLAALGGLGLFLSLASATPALAYVGPGLGLAAIASLLSLIGAILLGIVGFIWYPVKRLIRALKTNRKPD